MHRFVSSRSVAVLVAPTLLFMLVFYHLKKKKKSEEKESTERQSAPSLISPIPTRGGTDRYDVFLSFRGSDTRKSFTDHLYHSLVNAGTVPICVFRDNNSIPIGKEFGSQLLNAITQSKISIPIISENYASSKWCLRELIHMMHCKKSMSHMVLPIFYKVDPSDVRNLKGNFGKAFRSQKKQFDEKDIREGRQALSQVSYLSGWESEKIANGHEGELVKLVVQTVVSELRKDFQLDVPKQLVALDGQVKEIMFWIDSPSVNARMIGIYGMGGIGKTTLAKCIYNQLSNKFLHASFIPDIRETIQRHRIEDLQSQLITDILRIKYQVSKVDDGINIIKSRFKGKKVLILLDDIERKDQLNALARERNWFTSGSIIIVTTRYEAILDQSEFEVDKKYELNEIDEKHSLLLFNRHAFHMDHSLRNFEDISHDIISTMGGLPLALEVIGSYLYGKTNRNVWDDLLKQLKEQPHRDVQKILKISYDALDDGHKEIFLDIACFLIGKESKFAIYMWNDYGLYASQGIEELKLRCLVKIGDDGKLRMHDQLRDLGRSIIYHGQLHEGCSRICVNKEASKVLMEKKETKRIQAVRPDDYCGDPFLDGGPADHLQTYTNEHLKNIRRSRFLQMRGAGLSRVYDELYFELRWLHWFDIEHSLSFSAINLYIPKLVVLQLSHSQITEDSAKWSSRMIAKGLKVLELESCNDLRSTPDLSAFTQLEILILRQCYKLKKVHPSIGKVKSLISLDLSGCKSLEVLPREMGELEELKELILDEAIIKDIPTSIGSLRKLEILSAFRCSSLRQIPNSIGNLSSLQHINLGGCQSLREIPSSIGNPSSLQHINLGDCQSLREIPNSIGDLQNLQHLDISSSGIEKLPSVIGRLKKLQNLSLGFCTNAKGEIPSEIGELSSLKILKIICAHMSYLPESIQNLSSLQHLSLQGCYKLWELPELPSGLTYLALSCQSPRLPQLDKLKYLEDLTIDCSSIETLDLSQLNRLKRLHAKYCHNLVEIQGHYNLKFLEEICIFCCMSIERLILPELQCLKQLQAIYCDNLVEIRGLDKAEFLEALDISHCGSIKRLPNLSCFETLEKLNINGCRNLCSLKSLERFLSCRSICITGCQSLEELPNLSKFKILENFTMTYVLGVTKIPGVEESRSLTHIDISGCRSIEALPDLSGCEKLQSLVVRGCKKLTQFRGLEKLNLIYLDISGCNASEIMPKLPGTHVVTNNEGEEYVIRDISIILR